MPDKELTESESPAVTPKRKPAAKKAPESAQAEAAPPKAAPKRKPAAAKATVSAPKATPIKPKAPSKNGSVKTAKQPSVADTPQAPVMDRAEDTLDDLGKKVGSLFASAAKGFRKAAAVGREELEDLWAEAQSIRRGDTK